MSLCLFGFRAECCLVGLVEANIVARLAPVCLPFDGRRGNGPPLNSLCDVRILVVPAILLAQLSSNSHGGPFVATQVCWARPRAALEILYPPPGIRYQQRGSRRIYCAVQLEIQDWPRSGAGTGEKLESENDTAKQGSATCHGSPPTLLRPPVCQSWIYHTRLMEKPLRRWWRPPSFLAGWGAYRSRRSCV